MWFSTFLPLKLTSGVLADDDSPACVFQTLRGSRRQSLPEGPLAALPPLSVRGKSELLHFASAGWPDPDGGGGVLYRAS